MNEPDLTDHQRRLLDDFVKRAKGMSALNLAVGVLGVAVGFIIGSHEWLAVLAAGLGGGLVGVSLEKRYLGEMREIILKLSRRA
jgi:hypothetical protein